MASSTLLGQIHGTPASVTSMGGFRGGSFSNPPGVPASVTSLGPRGFQNLPCCTQPGLRYRYGAINTGTRGTIDGRTTTNRRRFDHFRRGYRGFGSYGYPLYGPYYGYVPLYDYSNYDYSSYDPPDPSQQYEPVVKADVTIRDDHKDSGQLPTEQAALTTPAPPAAPAPEQDPTILAFRDGHRLEVRNYAIVGQTLFNFDSHTSRKIPLSDLDLETTRKLNDDRGNEFHVPGQ
ncbi:MAG: hypothetical protein JO187_03300 [Acidobacteria bacterium]|nr:hypothetical protein [Acidobacteriaceae bacterium]MBV9608562.1 hypothetical protein [Acidobacteriota bacterium]